MKKIEIISRAVILKKEGFLLCKEKNNDYYFFPGGHVEFNEFSKKALKRELQEELSLKVNELKLIGVVENIYFSKGTKRQEVNFVYFTNSKEVELKSREEHIDFFLIKEKDFQKEDVRPKKLKNEIIKWRKNKKFFHIMVKD